MRMGATWGPVWVVGCLIGVASGQVPRVDYVRLSQEARELGRLEKYARIARRTVELKLDKLKLTARVPEAAEAYDAVPIEFELSGDCGPDQRIAVEAVAFEDKDRRAGRHLYDLAVPGPMDLRIEYLGSVTGVFDPSRVSRLTAKSRHKVFPPYVLEPFTRSGTVKQGSYTFFKFRITNIGRTILDPEGFGGWMAVPIARLLDDQGRPVGEARPINQFERHLEYLYPGESFEQWVSFWHPAPDPVHCRTLPLGRHVIEYQAAYRWNRDFNWSINMWSGRTWHVLRVPITVAAEAAQTPLEGVEESAIDPDPDPMPRHIRRLEEFMTGLRIFEREEVAGGPRETLHLQVAPWTRHVVLKLIGNTAGRITTAEVPLEVSPAGLAIRPRPDNPFVVVRDGKAEPALCTQVMPAMRSSSQLGPNPEQHLPERLREMLDLGVNVICTTAGDWHQPQIYSEEAFVGDIQAETWKYYYDAIVPRTRVPVFGWGLFPARTAHVLHLGRHYWREPIDVPFVQMVYTYAGSPDLDVAHPDFPRLYAGAILFNHKRWGRLWYRTADGEVPIDVEDSWGWHRDDINVRYVLGEEALKRWRRWLAERYGSLERLNQAWGTAYTSYEEIDPQKDQGNEGRPFDADLTHLAPVYNRPEHPFHDWTAATEDWDLFRTELRCDIYEQILRHVRRVIPKAQINIRTEGSIVPVPVDADDPNPHMRHVRYSQRRQALIAEVLARRKVFRYHSDYTTLPYTETEWRTLLRRLSEQGMRGNYLPQFCTARDMLVNPHYGRDYQMNYNLPRPAKALMMHVLQAAYPVWRAQYEEGHCPGVLWEDYMCDGFVTETQKRELKLFRQRLNAAVASAPSSP